MPITKQQWTEIETILSNAWGTVVLKIDGYTVSLYVVKEKNLKYVIQLYVNGILDGKWLVAEPEADEARRFFRKISKFLFKPKERAEFVKMHGGKRCPKADLERINRQYSYYRPIWPGVKAMRRHFEKNNQSLEVVNIGYVP